MTNRHEWIFRKPSREELKNATLGMTPSEREDFYREQGVSPSGVIGGIYNDAFLPVEGVYSDSDRDWEADA